jgi:uncharacterized membrane protein YqjE
MQLAEHLRALIDAFSELMAQHIKLARVELKEDAKKLGTQAGKIAAFTPLILVGYILLCVAASLFLTRFVPADAAFLIVAGINLVVGGVGIFLAVRKLRSTKVMDETKAELQTTAIALRSEHP